jgi:phospholipase/carboxylesterase
VSTLRTLGLVAGLLVFGGCAEYAVTVAPTKILAPRLSPHVTRATVPSIGAGMHRFKRRFTDIVAYVPASALTRSSVPVRVLLHGSARDVEQLMQAHIRHADANGVVILAPYAANGTWDAIYTNFGPDVAGIDVALAWVFEALPVNRSRIELSGFSDGATYALALGRANGDLFSRIIAYSPGFIIDVVPVGNPPIAISHGTHDEQLPFATTRDKIVPALKEGGYGVDFHSFDGPHIPLSGLIEESLARLGGTDDEP